MKKTLLLFVIALMLGFAAGVGRADSGFHYSGTDLDSATGRVLKTDPLRLTISNDEAWAGRSLDFARSSSRESTATFAQLDGSAESAKFSPMRILEVIALGVLACRLFGLLLAKEMADHEHRTHRARAAAYRGLDRR